jgi:hypothetical protein
MNELIIFGTAAFFAVGCNRSDADQTTTTTSATRNPGPSIELGGDANDTTIDRITDARCARELACNDVGANK